MPIPSLCPSKSATFTTPEHATNMPTPSPPLLYKKPACQKANQFFYQQFYSTHQVSSAQASIIMPKRKQYSITECLRIVDRIHNGEQQTKVAREEGVPESTVRGWLKDETRLREFVDNMDEDVGLTRKRAKQAQDPVLDKALFEWFVQERSEGMPISGSLIKMQAQKMDKQLHGEDSKFLASQGFLNMGSCHGISSVKLVKIC